MKKIEITMEQAEEISQIVTMTRRQLFWETDKACSKCQSVKEVQTMLVQKYGEDVNTFNQMLDKIFIINVPRGFCNAELQA